MWIVLNILQSKWDVILKGLGREYKIGNIATTCVSEAFVQKTLQLHIPL